MMINKCVCFLAILTGFFVSTSKVYSLQNEKKPDIEMVVQKGHSKSVFSVSFSPDGKYIVSGSEDKTIKLWSIHGRLIGTFKGHSDNIYSVAFSPDGKYIASGGGDKTMKLWSIHGRLIGTFKGHSEGVNSVSFSPDGKYIVSGSDDDTIKLWSIDGKLIRTFEGHHSSVNSVSFSPNGKYITSGSWDDTIKLWNIDGRLIRTFKGHSDEVLSVSFSPDGKYIASGSWGKAIILWSIHGRLIRTLGEYFDNAKSVSFSPDGKYIISAGGWGDKTIKLWSIKGKLIRTFKEHSYAVLSVSFSPDGKYIVSGSEDKTIKLWSIDGRLIRSFKGHSFGVDCVSFSPDGKRIASGSWDLTMKLWSIDGKLIRIFQGHSNGVKSVSFSPDGKYIISGSWDKTIKLWSLDGKLIRTFKGHSGEVSSVSFSPDGKYIISGSWDKTIKLWSIDGKLIRTFEGHSGSVDCVSFSPDGKYIASGSSRKAIKLWSLKGKLIRTFKGHSGEVSSVSFSPDGKYIASGSDDSTIKLWSLDGKHIRTFKGHSGSVKSVSFSPNGRYIISGSEDKTNNLCNIETGAYISLVSAANDWIMYTHDGYFDSSKNGGELVAMVKGLTAFGVDQFAIKNNRPDIILKRLGIGNEELINHYYNQYKRRLRRLGITEEQLSSDYHVPEAKILDTKQDGKFVELRFNLSDIKYNLKRYNIYVNDVPIFGAYGKEVTGKNVTKTEEIELISGENKIEVSCINEAGVESYRVLTFADYKEEVKGDLYYIGFGVSNYKNSKLNLKYAHMDAADLGNLFSKMKEKFNRVFVKTYLNKEVTVDNIKKAKEFLKDAKVGDTFVLFIAGHGVHDTDKEATYYYLTYNADVKNLSRTAADFDLIEDLMQGIAPRNKLFLIDACESGEADEEVENQYFAMAGSRGLKARTARGMKVVKKEVTKTPRRAYLFQQDRFIYNDLIRRSGAIVFSSSRGDEFSYENDNFRNGLFTEEIINSLTKKDADKNNDTIITTDELRDYVMGTVPKLSNDLQHPTVDRDNIYQRFSFQIVKPGLSTKIIKLLF